VQSHPYIEPKEEPEDSIPPTEESSPEESGDLTPRPESPAEAQPASRQASIPNCPHQRLIELYHEILPELPRVKTWEGQRPKHLTARWKHIFTRHKFTSLEEGLEYFRKFFLYIRGSPFLMGQTAKPFRCSLPWIVKADNYAKIIESNYHAKES